MLYHSKGISLHLLGSIVLLFNSVNRVVLYIPVHALVAFMDAIDVEPLTVKDSDLVVGTEKGKGASIMSQVDTKCVVVIGQVDHAHQRWRNIELQGETMAAFGENLAGGVEE